MDAQWSDSPRHGTKESDSSRVNPGAANSSFIQRLSDQGMMSERAQCIVN